MRRYIDTSVLTAVYTSEQASLKAQKALQQCEPVISSLTRLEFASAVSKKHRMGSFSKEEAQGVLQLFSKHQHQGVFAWAELNPSVWEVAMQWMSTLKTPLRTLDALHLAMALHHDLTVLTADHHMIQSAHLLGVDVESL
ncbi:MAG: type II toxin-antitoxin system VapC family toxin [Phycisphaerales bacterium]|nr:type II toxin-antitoxin system VapC family toxin [Phycisphaerales bacterium]